MRGRTPEHEAPEELALGEVWHDHSSTMRRTLKLAVTDFGEGFEYNPTGKAQVDNLFYRILAERFDIEIAENPEILIYSVFSVRA